jgi:hypothetical protein
MNVITDVVQLVLHYSKHIGGVLDILRTELPSEAPVKLPDAVVRYAYRGCYNSTGRDQGWILLQAKCALSTFIGQHDSSLHTGFGHLDCTDRVAVIVGLYSRLDRLSYLVLLCYSY